MLLATQKSYPESADSSLLNILVLCTGNSARSVIAEALFNHIGKDHFRAFSAGSKPTGKVNPYALEQIAQFVSAAPAPLSKSWNEFAVDTAPTMDIVITVCANAAAEVCPAFPGAPEHVHWGLPDPAAVKGEPEKIRAAFHTCRQTLFERITTLLVQMPERGSRVQVAAAMRALAEVY